MINKLIGAGLIFELLLAVSISLVFVARGQPIQPVEIGSDFMSFISSCSAELNNHKIAIPDIPVIPRIANVSINGDSNWWSAVLDFFINFANALFTFVNAMIRITNVGIQFVNVIIQLVELIVIILKNIITLKDNFTPMVDSSPSALV